MKEVILADLQAGLVINALAGDDRNRTEYRFRILEAGENPICLFQHRPPYDVKADQPLRVPLEGPVRVVLEGCVEEPEAAIDNEEADPDDAQDIEPGDGKLWVGGLITILDRRSTAPPVSKIRYRLHPPIRDFSVS